MFASDSTLRVVVSSEKHGDVEVCLQKLSKRSLDKARLQREIVLAQMSRNLGADIVVGVRERAQKRNDEEAAVEDQKPKTELTIEQRKAARYGQFDQDAIVIAAVKSWSINVPCDEAHKADLDEPTSDRLFREAVDFSCGPVDPDEVEQAQKKD